MRVGDIMIQTLILGVVGENRYSIDIAYDSTSEMDIDSRFVAHFCVVDGV